MIALWFVNILSVLLKRVFLLAGKIVTHLPSLIADQLGLLVYELQNLGITHVGHGLIYPDKTPTAYFSVSEWAERYDKEDLVSRDPIRACALQTNYRVIPWESILVDRKQRMIVDERKKYFQAHSGLLISVKTPLFHETLVLGCDSRRLSVLELFESTALLGNYLLQFRAIHNQYYG
jgi:hypothetical protein